MTVVIYSIYDCRAGFTGGTVRCSSAGSLIKQVLEPTLSTLQPVMDRFGVAYT